MAFDVDKARKYQESQQRGGDFLQFDTGDTLVYVHPGCRTDEDTFEPTTGLNFVPVVVHYGIGGKAMAVSLDPETNPIISHPFIKANLKKKKVRLTGECPVKEALEDGTLEGDDADNSRPQTRYMFGMTPLKYRRKSSMEWSDLEAKPSIAFVGKQIMDGILACCFDNGDISDPAAAYLLRITKEGKDRNTKYSVKAEPSSLKKPFVLPKALAAKIEKAIADGGDCDTFKIVANMIKPPDEVKALLAGVKVSHDADDDEGEEEDDEDELPKPKTKAKAPPADEEEEEEEAPKPKPKAKKPTPPPADEEEEEEEEAPKPKAKKKPTPPPDEEEEEEEPPAKPVLKKKPAPPADDEEEDPPAKPVLKKKAKAPPPEEEEEEEEAPKPKAKKKPAADDDGDELDLESLEEALGNLDDEEEEEAPKPKKKAKAPPPDEEEEDDEEPPPPPKKKAAKK
jgi:hypothetical protein